MQSRPVDERALAAFLEEAAPRVLAFARRLCGSDADAEDVMQEAMERAWRHRAGWDPTRNPDGWLLRTAFHAFVDLRRRRRPLERLDPGAPAKTGACPVELRDELARALRPLSRIEHAVLVGFHRDALTLEELARRHGLPLNTVKSHLHRARRKLREQEPR